MYSKYYKILGLNENASLQEVKSAYRKLAMKYHPDRNSEPGATEKFKEIKHAYEVITNKVNPDTNSYSQQGFDSDSYTTSDYDFRGGFDDIFKTFFSTESTHESKYRDSVYKITITLDQAFWGCEYVANVSLWQLCPTCDGRKYQHVSGKSVCYLCNGTGYLKKLNSFFSIKRVCTRCAGKGYVVIDSCAKCTGQGKVQVANTITLTIPKGIVSGTRILLKDKKELVDPDERIFVAVYFEVHLSYGKGFTLDKRNNLHYRFKVKLVAALLGIETVVTIFKEPVTLKVPACTKDNDIVIINGKGYYCNNSAVRSDLYVHIVYIYPKVLTLKQEQALRALRELF
ncbi:DnaJ domain-containing protein [Candidatus Vidania fulgoroideae]|uniref:DnaJ domain-containing protein n=1 Tax=Candidatus Vidania fulgoroideorum TaxID=881286 RepID=A0A974XDN0_9PROT|nr:DnaJ domain-containing protein [Candidatus Vidania fulgoroideae]